MIDSTHLRIGNLVQHYQLPLNKLAYAVVPITGRVTAIQGKYFTIDHKISSQNSKAEPILVTYEMLEKSGLVKTNGFIWDTENGGVSDIYDKGDFRIHIEVSRGVFYTTQPKSIDYKYVHELQNLFFALTGTELEIKL